MLKMPNPVHDIRSQLTAKFYSVSDGLEPHIAEILNQKLSQIRDYTVDQMRLNSHHSETLRLQVDLMESSNKGGLKFADMDSAVLIKRMGEIE